MTQPYAGQYLRIDLTAGSISRHPIAETDVRQWLLGSGYAAWLFSQEMDPTRDPYDPHSPLYIFNGVLSGTFAPTGCRSSWCGRSPLTGIWGEANMGGHWGAELRFAGLDGLVISGRADQPVYLYIHDGGADIRPAGHLWGKNHYETYDLLRAETDPKAQIASIGVAGENRVRFAGVMQGGIEHARTAGRTGMGALLGSKNLKAIVTRGKARPGYADEAGFRATVKAQNASIKEFAIGLSKLGTAGGVPGAERVGDLPLRNWRDGTWPDAAQISGQKISETIHDKHTFCFACPIGCGKTVNIQEGAYAGTVGHGPEYETLGGFGGLLLNGDLNSIAHINYLCNDYGLDTISTSAVIACAVEAFERGLLTLADTDGLRLAWGNAPAIVACVHAIAQRTGCGDRLAEGVQRLAAALAAPDLDITVKGLELPYHDPRAFLSMAANYATANRGACHMESCSYWPGYGQRIEGLDFPDDPDRLSQVGSGALAVRYQDYVSVYNPLGLCKFIIKGHVGPAQIAAIVNPATGWSWTADDVMAAGARLFNLKRQINTRYGIRAADDTLPARLLTHARPSGGAAGSLPDFKLIMDEYYAARGWDRESGLPVTG